jgi:hypothetical protein
MIPVSESLAGSTAELPAAATYWMPDLTDPREYFDEGIGYFRGCVLITDVTVAEARSVVRAERRIVSAIGAVARDAVEFDNLCHAADCEGGGLPPAVQDRLGDIDPYALGGLEAGVSGLVYTLNATGCVTAASCRSHPVRSWSPCPVVLFATDEPHTRTLEPMVAASGCLFGVDPARPDLLAVTAPSVTPTPTSSPGLNSAWQGSRTR